MPGERPGRCRWSHDSHRPDLDAEAAGSGSRSGVAAGCERGRVLVVDGIHDLGGMQGFGPVGHSPAEPAFHDRWEAVAFALFWVVEDALNAGEGELRYSMERMDPGTI
jgi:hypothetical protein